MTIIGDILSDTSFYQQIKMDIPCDVSFIKLGVFNVSSRSWDDASLLREDASWVLTTVFMIFTMQIGIHVS
jgi:hypothetical protein